MSAVDLSLNYEDLLQTVKESDRGRWFLTEFENRLRKSDTGNILASIAKLEGVIAGMGAIAQPYSGGWCWDFHSPRSRYFSRIVARTTGSYGCRGAVGLVH